MTISAQLFRPALLAGNLSWASSSAASASSFLRLVSCMDWGAAWHIYSCALAKNEMISDFDPILPDLIAGLALKREAYSENSTPWIWDGLAEDACFLRVYGVASELACGNFIAAISRNPRAGEIFSSLMNSSSPSPPSLRTIVAQAFGNVLNGDAFGTAVKLNALPLAGLEADWVMIMANGGAPHVQDIAHFVFKNKWAEARRFLLGKPTSPESSEFFNMLKATPEIAPIVLEKIDPEILREYGAARILGEPFGGGALSPWELAHADEKQAMFIKTLWGLSILDSESLYSYMGEADLSACPKTKAVAEALVLSEASHSTSGASRQKLRI